MDKPTIAAATAGGATSLIMSLLDKAHWRVAVARALIGTVAALFVAPWVCEHRGLTGSARDVTVYLFGLTGHYVVEALSTAAQTLEKRSSAIADDAVTLSWRRMRKLLGGKTKDEPARDTQDMGESE